ncbi:MAG: hypothetical protein IPH75_01565 [bacterium]|nr:hypothetical protein [bacterium]
MITRMKILALAGLIAVAALISGCLVSGTFIIVETFDFTAGTGFYHYTVDITDEADWDSHKDDIDMIDAVGAEFYITSTEAGDVTFSVWVDDFGDDHATEGAVVANATPIIEDFTVAPGTTKITYAQSLGVIKNLDRLKALAKIGQFEYYGTSSGNLGNTFVVDSGKVIVTFSASGS